MPKKTTTTRLFVLKKDICGDRAWFYPRITPGKNGDWGLCLSAVINLFNVNPSCGRFRIRAYGAKPGRPGFTHLGLQASQYPGDNDMYHNTTLLVDGEPECVPEWLTEDIWKTFGYDCWVKVTSIGK